MESLKQWGKCSTCARSMLPADSEASSSSAGPAAAAAAAEDGPTVLERGRGAGAAAGGAPVALDRGDVGSEFGCEDGRLDAL